MRRGTVTCDGCGGGRGAPTHSSFGPWELFFFCWMVTRPNGTDVCG